MLSNSLKVIFSNDSASCNSSLRSSSASSAGRKLCIMVHGVWSATSSGSYKCNVLPFFDFAFFLGGSDDPSVFVVAEFVYCLRDLWCPMTALFLAAGRNDLSDSEAWLTEPSCARSTSRRVSCSIRGCSEDNIASLISVESSPSSKDGPGSGVGLT